jgi:hypothetical protein
MSAAPGWKDGDIPTPDEWNSWWARKLDNNDSVITTAYLPLTGGNLSGPVTLVGGTFTGTFAGNHTYSGNITFSGTSTTIAGGTFTGTFAGNHTYSGNITFSGTATSLAGGTFTGTFAGTHTYSGAVTFSGTATSIAGGTFTGSYAGNHTYSGNITHSGSYTNTFVGSAVVVNSNVTFGANVTMGTISNANGILIQPAASNPMLSVTGTGTNGALLLRGQGNGGINIGSMTGGNALQVNDGGGGALNPVVLTARPTGNFATISLADPAQGIQIMTNPASGKLAFWGATPIIRPTVSGAKAANAALTSLMTALAALGLVTDTTTA